MNRENKYFLSKFSTDFAEFVFDANYFDVLIM